MIIEQENHSKNNSTENNKTAATILATNKRIKIGNNNIPATGAHLKMINRTRKQQQQH